MMFYKKIKDDNLRFTNGNFFVNKKSGSSRTTLISNLNFYSCNRYFTNPLLIKKLHMLGIQHNLKKAFVAQKVEKKHGGLGSITNKSQNKKREKKRSSLILPQHIGRVFFVHNGKTFSSIHIYRKMLGHKFGEFASTRKKPVHKKKR